MIPSLLTLSAAAQAAHRAAVETGDAQLIAELKHLGFEVAHLLAKVVRKGELLERVS